MLVMTLRKLKQALGFQAARHGSEPLYARVGDQTVEVPIEANVISFPDIGLFYFGISKGHSGLFRLEGERLRPISEGEVAETAGQIDSLLADVVSRRSASALAKVDAALSEASRELPEGWRIAVGPEGKARAVRLRTDDGALTSEAGGLPAKKTPQSQIPIGAEPGKRVLREPPISEDPFQDPSDRL